MIDIYERYRNDNKFRQIVDAMTHMLMGAEVTPSELRLAAILAAINAENHKIKHFVDSSEARHVLYGELDALQDKINRASREEHGL